MGLAAGVVCEYNPFHNGHAYQLSETRARTGCGYIVCVMSGAFTQRGIPAVLDAHARARMALMNGADAVFELPTLFAVRDARAFARGAVALLDALGVCDWLSFGCEDIAALDAACAMDESDPAVVEHLHERLARGESFARARGLPNMPNVVLGAEYRRALESMNSAMRPIAIQRAPRSCSVAAGLAVISASELRSMLPDADAVQPYVPQDVYEIINGAGGALRFTANMDSFIIGMLRTMPVEALALAADVGEGLEHRILDAAGFAATREELIARVKCKRYTYARISRILAQAALGVTKELAAAHPEPEYARLLGFRESARPLMRMIGRGSRIPIIHKVGRYRYDPVFRLDMRAEALASLNAASQERRRGDGSLTSSVVVIK
ncbi:MAG: nucleotidyltransferase family protein [Oscillospiraceae bacterium]|jgi:predicted nucleotidyltransferase|nr:nucleotidyltransferase family protein [Oscillospiraceae bacterium]